MAWEKSAPRILAVDFSAWRRKASVMSPVPQHKSRTLASGRERMSAKVRAVFLHHRRSTLKDRTWFSRSYRGAMEVNISRTARAADWGSAAPSGAAPRTADFDESVNVEFFVQP